jgi:hypothetical protein
MAVAALSGAAVPAATSAASTQDTSTSASGSAAATQAALLESNTPKTVVLNPATGAVVSITVGAAAVPSVAASPAISNGTDCASGNGCYYTPVVNATYHNRSFSGSAGTVTGNWPQRNAWDSGAYYASACWTSACSPEVGPNTYSTFGGSIVTGTSFTIH